ncbi:MAG: NAD-dependent epimerase/dehydratase family protein [Deltaproteobacteria bacterium]|nr:MAG: NAD-dependent epimerase/dehydratase family protein [Deltaproteobacteria bacterium]
MKKVLLTGATGFVGGRLAIQLIKEGYQVKALVRDPSRANDLAKAGVELVSGDVTDLQSIEHSLDGVEGIFHLAAIYDFGVDPEKMRQVNIEGTRNILDAAQRARINRIVYCGSDTSLGNTHGKLCDETKTHDGNHFCSAYEETKHLAHRLVIQRIQEGAPIINAIVSTVYGPGDKSAIGEFIELHLAGQLSMALDREAGYTFAHVDDVARALLLAYEKGTLGQSYLISGTPATFGELFDTMSSLTGIDSPKQMPKWALKFVPILIPLVGFLIGKSRAALRELFAMGQNVTRFFSGEKHDRCSGGNLARYKLAWPKH